MADLYKSAEQVMGDLLKRFESEKAAVPQMPESPTRDFIQPVGTTTNTPQPLPPEPKKGGMGYLGGKTGTQKAIEDLGL